MVRIGFFVQPGASYQLSAETMSSLPSLLKSATAVDSAAPASIWTILNCLSLCGEAAHIMAVKAAIIASKPILMSPPLHRISKSSLSRLRLVVVDLAGNLRCRRGGRIDRLFMYEGVGQELVRGRVGAREQRFERRTRRPRLALLHCRIAAIGTPRRIAAPEREVPEEEFANA